jgi:hypothetical protein
VPRLTQAYGKVSAATPSLEAAESNQLGGIAGGLIPGSLREARSLASRWVQAVLKASPISLTPLAFTNLSIGYNDVEGGFEEPYSIAARRWEKMEDPSALFNGFLSYSTR